MKKTGAIALVLAFSAQLRHLRSAKHPIGTDRPIRHLNQKNSGELVGFDRSGEGLCKRIRRNVRLSKTTGCVNPVKRRLTPSCRLHYGKRQQNSLRPNRLYAADSRLVVAEKFRYSADSRIAEGKRDGVLRGTTGAFGNEHWAQRH